MTIDDLDEPLDEEYGDFMDGIESNGVYLSGPIRCADDNGIEWREQLIEDYPEVNFNNPLNNYSPETHDILNDPADFDENSEKTQVLPTEYVTEDKIMINSSEAFFLGLPEVIARGSSMEAMYAFMRGIPLFVWIVEEQEESGWVFNHAEFMSYDRDEVMEEVKGYLRSVNTNE